MIDAAVTHKDACSVFTQLWTPCALSEVCVSFYIYCITL